MEMFLLVLKMEMFLLDLDQRWRCSTYLKDGNVSTCLRSKMEMFLLVLKMEMFLLVLIVDGYVSTGLRSKMDTEILLSLLRNKWTFYMFLPV